MQIHALYTQENAGDGESGDGCAPGEGFVWPGAAGIGPDGEVICYLCGRAATPTYASYPPPPPLNPRARHATAPPPLPYCCFLGVCHHHCTQKGFGSSWDGFALGAVMPL